MQLGIIGRSMKNERDFINKIFTHSNDAASNAPENNEPINYAPWNDSSWTTITIRYLKCALKSI